MSRGSIREYILRKQDDYIGELNRRRKSKVLDEVCAVTGLERKYASRLLSGAREYRARKSRGKSHGQGAEELLAQAWRAAGCPNEKYLKVVVAKVLEDLGQLREVRRDEAAEVLSMSASTMGRILLSRASRPRPDNSSAPPASRRR